MKSAAGFALPGKRIAFIAFFAGEMLQNNNNYYYISAYFKIDFEGVFVGTAGQWYFIG